jgi:Arc/MetJ-type ribon-helix-helix transcriptional regulator
VRVPAPLVDYADQLVAAGRIKSRSAFVAGAMEHERKRLEDEREVEEFYANGGSDAEMDALAEAGWHHLDESWNDHD